MTTEPQGAYMIWLPAGGAKSPPSAETIARGEHYIRMEGKETYRFATRTLASTALAAIQRAGLEPADIDLFIPHQANIRIIEAVAKGLDLPMERMFVNLDKYGNTSAASVPIALAEAVNEGRVKVGDNDRPRRVRGRLHERRGRPSSGRPTRPAGIAGDAAVAARRCPRAAARRLGLGRPDPRRARRDHGPAGAGRRAARRRRPGRARAQLIGRSTHDRPDRQGGTRDRRVARHRAGDRDPARDAGRGRRVQLPRQRGGRGRDGGDRRGPRPQGRSPSRATSRDPASAEAAVKAAIDAFGKIDILVNNAGITRDDLIMRMSEEAWREVLETNLFGAFWMTKAVTRPMLKARAGRIINITSVSGQAGQMGQANYSAAKAGLIGLTKATARELASRGITVNAVAPGLRADRADPGPAAAAPRRDHEPHAARPLRDDRRGRERRRVPRIRRGRLHHGPGAGRGRRPRHDVTRGNLLPRTGRTGIPC